MHDNIFTYTGQPYDEQAKIQVLGGYRAKMNNHGMFLKQDSDSPFGGSALVNAYTYVEGNPEYWQDPSGHMVTALQGGNPRTTEPIEEDEPLAVFVANHLTMLSSDTGDEQNDRELHPLSDVIYDKQVRKISELEQSVETWQTAHKTIQKKYLDLIQLAGRTKPRIEAIENENEQLKQANLALRAHLATKEDKIFTLTLALDSAKDTNRKAARLLKKRGLPKEFLDSLNLEEG